MAQLRKKNLDGGTRCCITEKSIVDPLPHWLCGYWIAKSRSSDDWCCIGLSNEIRMCVYDRSDVQSFVHSGLFVLIGRKNA